MGFNHALTLLHHCRNGKIKQNQTRGLSRRAPWISYFSRGRGQWRFLGSASYDSLFNLLCFGECRCLDTEIFRDLNYAPVQLYVRFVDFVIQNYLQNSVRRNNVVLGAWKWLVLDTAVHWVTFRLQNQYVGELFMISIIKLLIGQGVVWFITSGRIQGVLNRLDPGWFRSGKSFTTKNTCHLRSVEDILYYCISGIYLHSNSGK